MGFLSKIARETKIPFGRECASGYWDGMARYDKVIIELIALYREGK